MIPYIRQTGKNFRREWPLHLMLLIPVVISIIYYYIPMAGILIAFENYRPSLGFFRSQWVGLDNFRLIFSMPGFPEAVRNTVVIAVAKIVLGIAVPVTFALLLNEMSHLKVKRAVQTVTYMPHFISWVLMAGILTDLLAPDGLLNGLLLFFGAEKPVIFLADAKSFPVTVIISHIWKEFGYGSVVYMAALAGVNPELYEAASIDGAGRWKQTLHVTLPGIASTVALMTVLSIGNVLNAGFDQVFNLYTPMVYETGDIIDTYVYRMGFQNMQYSISTAAGLFKSVISAALICIAYKAAHKITGYRVF